MKLRKEQLVLAGVAALLGLLSWRGAEGGGRAGSRRPKKPEPLASHPVPDPALALPRDRAGAGALARDLFSPPRDTEPLPLLALERPPLPSLGALLPPPEPGLSPRVFARLLRIEGTPRNVPGLFGAEGEEGGASEEDAYEAEARAGAGNGASPAAAQGPGKPSASRLTPEERLALVEGWKKLHDWIRVHDGEPIFGRIASPDRYALRTRPKEPILFVEVVPETGAERFPGQAPVAFERARVREFAFADTPANFVQLRRRELARPLLPTQYADALAFAERCIELRHEAREALAVAEEVLNLAAETSDGAQDPAPRLHLARCYEASFRLGKAYAEYLALLERFPLQGEVHAALGELEARLRLFDSAEARLREAARLGRRSWRAQHALGRFLCGRGRWEEALAPLQEAFQAEPTEARDKLQRARIRTDLAAAFLALGRAEEALAQYERALQADATWPPAIAGRAAARLLAGKGPAQAEESAATAAGFEVLCNAGVADLAAERHAEARDRLISAAEADPLRASRAWRALSSVAELGGHPEEALRFVELAFEADPTDAWTLFQRGRLLALRGDDAAARESFLAALAEEADFADALAWLGALASRNAASDAAERYFERALSLEATRAEVHALRGLNLLEAPDLARAEESFRAALALQGAQPLSRAGLAWVAYRRGDPAKAINLLAELDDERRAQPESDPYRAWSRAQIRRIQDHEAKVLWRDTFERKELKREWDVEEAAGPRVAIVDGEVVIQGNFDENGSARLLREYAAPDFVSIELTLTVAARNNARAGLFIAKERRRGAGASEVQGMVAVARRKDGGLAVLVMDKAAAEPPWEEIPPAADAPWWPADRGVRLRIEKIGAGNDVRGRISVDGVPVREDFRLSALSTPNQNLRVGVFVEGQTGLPCRVGIDDVEVVYRIAGRGH